MMTQIDHIHVCVGWFFGWMNKGSVSVSSSVSGEREHVYNYVSVYHT